MLNQHLLLTSPSVPAPHLLLFFFLPLKCRHFLGRLLLELGQRAVLLEAFVVQELTHGDVGQLLRQLKSLIDVEEDGEDVLVDAGAHLDYVG